MYRVEITNTGDSVFKVSSKDYSFAVDTEGSGVTPPDALLASIGSCLGVYIRKYAEGSRLSLHEFSIAVEGDFSREQPVCFRQIRVRIDLKGVALDEHRKQALLAFIRNCPVHNTLKAAPEVEITLS